MSGGVRSTVVGTSGDGNERHRRISFFARERGQNYLLPTVLLVTVVVIS